MVSASWRTTRSASSSKMVARSTTRPPKGQVASRSRFVAPRVAYDNHVSGHSALEGATNFRPYFDPAAFRLVQGFEIGDVGSTIPNMRGPGFSQWDFSLLKDFRLWSESSRLQLRFEAQNLFNHMNAGSPNAAVKQRTFGMITGQTGSPRLAMVSAKIYFYSSVLGPVRTDNSC